MKNLIKLFSLIVLFAMATETYAQTFGVKAGLNIANQLVKDDNQRWSEDFTSKAGLHFGPTAEFDLDEMFSFQTGLILSSKGYNYDLETFFGGNIDGKVNLLYLDIPLTVRAAYEVAGVRVFGIFGPYIGVALSGRSEFQFSGGGQSGSEEEDLEFGSEDADDYKRLDFGLNVGYGVEINSITAGLSYGLGFADISPDDSNGFVARNRVFSLSVGYKFTQFSL